MKKLVLVEPVCRGSRLHWLWLTAKALQNKYDITIITREDCDSEHFSELMNGLKFNLIKVPVNFNGEWLPKISKQQWSKYLSVLLGFDKKVDKPYDLFFMALDDYLKAFFENRKSISRFSNIDRCFTVKYRVSCLTARITSPKQWIIGKIMQSCCRKWNIQTIVLDERLIGISVGNHNAIWLPDPWFGDFSPNHFSTGRDMLGYSMDDFVALSIGRQDERKGFSFLLDALPSALQAIPELKICIAGKIDSQFESKFSVLQSQFKNRVKHVQEFIPEEQLPLYFAMSSVVLMPYAPFFTATSGVLPRAAASQVSVLTTSHGLVADRVKRYKMGLTVDYGNAIQFSNALRAILDSKENSPFADGGSLFANTCSEQAFNERILEIF